MAKRIKQLYYRNELYDIVQYIRPTKCQTFAIVCRVVPELVNEDGSAVYEYLCLDLGNDIVAPVTSTTRKLVKSAQAATAAADKHGCSLEDMWLEFLNELERDAKEAVDVGT